MVFLQKKMFTDVNFTNLPIYDRNENNIQYQEKKKKNYRY